jgi:hypothetical protein
MRVILVHRQLDKLVKSICIRDEIDMLSLPHCPLVIVASILRRITSFLHYNCVGDTNKQSVDYYSSPEYGTVTGASLCNPCFSRTRFSYSDLFRQLPTNVINVAKLESFLFIC